MSVYFARCGAFVKIGFSIRPEQRVRSIRASRGATYPADFDHSQPVHLLRILPGCDTDDERALHVRFAQFRARGEWFHVTDELLHQIRHLRYRRPEPPEAPPLRLLPMPEVADWLACSRSHIYALVAAGELPTVEIRATGTRPKTRIRADDLEAFIEQRTRLRPA